LGAYSGQASSPQPGRQTAAAAFEEGQNAQQRGDLHLAVKHYTNAIIADPTLFQVYYQRGTALMGLGRDAEAERDFRKVIELQPDFTRAHRALGLLLLHRGETEESKREFARALELDPRLSGVRTYYASALIKGGDAAGAIEQLRIAIAQGEASPEAFALLGLAQERVGKPDDALADYNRAIAMDASNPIAREGRGRLFESRGDTQRAVEDYTVAYQAVPSREIALRLARLYGRTGQAQAAIQLYRGLLQEKPDDMSARVEMLRLMADNGHLEQAAREIESLIAGNHSDPRLLMLAGDVFFEARPEAAATYYKRALEADRSNNRARVQLGASLVRSQQYQSALPILSEAVAREPDNYPAHANLATAFFKLKQYPQAASEFLWILGHRPEVVASYYFLAISLDRMGDCEQALRAYEEFMRRASPSVYKNEIEEAGIRMGLLQKLAKDGKCKGPGKDKMK
jgi:tetratricopeptide (TPR) repeat protein